MVWGVQRGEAPLRFFYSPKSGGEGVEEQRRVGTVKLNPPSKPAHSIRGGFRCAQPTLHMHSRLRGNDTRKAGTRACPCGMRWVGVGAHNMRPHKGRARGLKSARLRLFQTPLKRSCDCPWISLRNSLWRTSFAATMTRLSIVAGLPCQSVILPPASSTREMAAATSQG